MGSEAREWSPEETIYPNREARSDLERERADAAAWERFLPDDYLISDPSDSHDSQLSSEEIPGSTEIETTDGAFHEGALGRVARSTASGQSEAARDRIAASPTSDDSDASASSLSVEDDRIENRSTNTGPSSDASDQSRDPPADNVEGESAVQREAVEKRLHLQDMPITDLNELLTDEPHLNGVYKVQLLDSSTNFLKPQNEEGDSRRGTAIPDGTQYAREAAASRLSDVLGLGVVPTTVERTEPLLDMDHASLQAAVPEEPLAERKQYSGYEQQCMAVFDYIAGNLDRNPDNYRTYADGRIGATDNGLCFPEDETCAIRSGFVADWFGQPIDDRIVEGVRNASDEKVLRALDSDAIGDSARNLVLARLREIQREGRITGQSWRGEVEYFTDSESLYLMRDRL